MTLHRKEAWLGITEALSYGEQLYAIMIEAVQRTYQITADTNNDIFTSL